MRQAKLRLTRVLGHVVSKVWNASPVSFCLLDGNKAGDDMRISYERTMGCWVLYIHLPVYPQMETADIVMALTQRLESLRCHTEKVIDGINNP